MDLLVGKGVVHDLPRGEDRIPLFTSLLLRCNAMEIGCRLYGQNRRGSEVDEVVRVSVRVSNGGEDLEVEVQAESIQGALQMVREHNPGGECEISFPIDPERFFVADPAKGVGTVETLVA